MEVEQQRPKSKKNLPILKLLESLLVPLRQNEYMQIKSVLCKHEYKLIQHIIRGGTRSLIIAYIGKTIVSFVQLMMKKKVKPSAFFRILYEEDTLRFVAFPTLYAIIQKGIMCYFRNNSEEDKKKYSFIAGYAAGFIGLSVLHQKKRSPWALYLLTRSLDTVFLSLQNRGHIKKRKVYYVLFMVLQVLVTGYAYGCEADALAPAMRNFYYRFGCETPSEISFRESWTEKTRLQLQK